MDDTHGANGIRGNSRLEPGAPRRLVFLIGLSGSGKSTVGRLLADRLGAPFVDTDAQIERETGRSVPEVFRHVGEPGFRALERDAVAATCALGIGVVATGGGAPLDAANRAAMRQAGSVIWLDAPTGVLAARLGHDAQHRPLLSGDPGAALEGLRAERESIYAELGPRVDASDQPEEIVARIVSLLGLSSDGPEPTSLPEPVWVRTPSQTYPVYVGSAVLERLPTILERTLPAGTLRVVADERVDAIHGARLRAALDGVPFTWHVMPAGEEHKTLGHAERLYDDLLGTAPERRDIVVAFGGGVVGDLAGFVAATLLRGVRLVQIPTTVLAQVDSSVGGKVAVDHPRGKNLIGAFHQPSLVVADVDLLRSLPAREIAAGWAEVVKIAVIQDAAFFDRIERSVEALLRLDPSTTAGAIRRAVELKARVVESDERDETGARAILNYGHTLGHAVESATGYTTLLHGEAVAIGMRGAAHLAREMGLLSDEAVARQSAVLDRLGLPPACGGASVAAIRKAMGFDKKRVRGQTTWILPHGLGGVCLRRDVPGRLVDEAMALISGSDGP